MRHLDLFAGIGGFSLAASWMGWETVAQVEWDKWCQKVLAKNFPNALRFGDIVEFNKMLQNGEIITNTRLLGQTFSEKQTAGIEQCCEEINPNTNRTEIHRKEKHTTKERINALGTIERSREMAINLGRIDIITGGFPCQPFSHAGKRKGVADERYLWPEMLRTIRILKPSFVVGENVAGLVSMDNGKTLDGILADLENEGYQVESFIIPACAVGAWHRRDRIWIVANKSGKGLQGSRQQPRKSKIQQKDGIEQLCSNVSDCDNQGLQRGTETGNITDIRTKRNKQSERHGKPSGGDYWQSEPSVGRVANGIPNRVDRLKGLGNAIVPQVVYQIFKAIENETNPINTTFCDL